MVKHFGVRSSLENVNFSSPPQINIVIASPYMGLVVDSVVDPLRNHRHNYKRLTYGEMVRWAGLVAFSFR